VHDLADVILHRGDVGLDVVLHAPRRHHKGLADGGVDGQDAAVLVPGAHGEAQGRLAAGEERLAALGDLCFGCGVVWWDVMEVKPLGLGGEERKSTQCLRQIIITTSSASPYMCTPLPPSNLPADLTARSRR